MEDLEPELVIIEEHVNCRKSNEIQFILSKQQIIYRKVTLGKCYFTKGNVGYRTPAVFMGALYMGSSNVLKDFIWQSKSWRF